MPTATSLALSSGSVCKYEFLTGEEGLPEKGLLEKAAVIKGTENLSFDSELKNRLIMPKKYQRLSKAYEFDGATKMIKNQDLKRIINQI